MKSRQQITGQRSRQQTPELEGPADDSAVGSPGWVADMQDVLGNAALVGLMGFAGNPAGVKQLGTSGTPAPLPDKEGLRQEFGDAVDGVAFFGGTPEARWACAALDAPAFTHGGTVVAAEAAPPREVLAHEVAHVVQQPVGSGNPTATAPAGVSAEGEAARGGATPGAAATGDLLRFPGPFGIPWDVPLPDLVGHYVREAVQEAGERVAEAAVAVAAEVVDEVRDRVVGAVVGIGQGLVDIARDTANAVGDALNLRENEDILDLEEDIAAGDEVVAGMDIADLLGLIRARRAGEDVPPEQVAAIQAEITALDNGDFRELIHVLDRAGLLMEVTRAVFGGEPGADEADMFEVPVATWRFWNAADDIAADVERANVIYEPHNIHVQALGARVVGKGEVEGIVGHAVPNAFGLDRSYSDETYTDADMVAVVDAIGVGQITSGLWVPTVVNDQGDQLSGTSMQTQNFKHRANIAFVATDNSGPDTFAHELGHILTREGHTAGDPNNLMESGATRDKDATGIDRLTDDQVAAIRADVLGYLRS